MAQQRRGQVGPQGEGTAFCRLQEDAGVSARGVSTATWQRDPRPEKNLCWKMLNAEKEAQK